MKNQTFVTLVSTIITLILVTILLSQIEIGDIEKLMQKLRPGYMVIGFLLYTLTYFFKALRFHFLLNRKIGLKALYSIVCAHNLAINIFPARSGELSLIYFLTKRHNKTVGQGVAVLFLARMLDIISISLIFLLFAFDNDQSAILSRFTNVAGILMLLIISILIIFYFYCSRFVEWLKVLSFYLKINEKKIINYIFNVLDEMILSLNNIYRYQFLLTVLISIGIWIILYFVNFTLLYAIGIDITFKSLLFASTFYFIISILPIQGISGFGTAEGGWALSFMAVGISKELAISSGFFSHLVVIFYILLLFLFDYTNRIFNKA